MSVIEPRPRRAMGPTEAARAEQVEAGRFATHRLRRVLIAFGTSLALVVGVLGVFGMGSASAAPESSLAVSLNPDRSSAVLLDSRTVRGQIYVFVRSQRGLEKVTFYLDDSSQSRTPFRTEFGAPFDFAGTASDGSAIPFDTANLAEGRHTITAVLTWSHRRTSVRRATFTVDNEVATTPPPSTVSPSTSTTTSPTTSPTASPSGSASTPTVTPTATTASPIPTVTTPPPSTVSPSASATKTPTASATASPSGSASSPTVTPTATTTSPTPTTTPPSGQVCTNPVWSSSTSNDGWSTDGYYVHNNMWNASGYRVNQTVEACSYRSWNAIATADNTARDGAVKTYPNVHKDYDSRPALSNFPVLTATHAADAPDTGIYNIGYDLWLNGVASSGSTEVMIWTDNQNQVPSGSRVASGVAIGGHTWDVYATSGNYRAFVATPEIPSGSVDLRAMIGYLIGRGLLSPNPTIGQICFGVEVVSTNGTPATFNFTDFSITDS